ncbi:MAG: hypothetical protein AMXMBFR53_20080 [Gemmatimonadota bacterium]
MASVVLLRGVNVGGHRTFRPTDLARELRHLDMVNIGAAGTFVVRRSVRRAALRAEIAGRLPFETEIMICGGKDVMGLLSRDFFEGRPDRREIVRFVSLLSQAPRPGPALPLELPSPSRWLLRVLARQGPFVVGEYRREMKAIAELGRLERVLGVSATTRSWSTMEAIGKALSGSEGGA